MCCSMLKAKVRSVDFKLCCHFVFVLIRTQEYDYRDIIVIIAGYMPMPSVTRDWLCVGVRGCNKVLEYG